MSFNYNANDIVLLSGDPIIFKSEEKHKEFKMMQPTLKQIYTNNDLLFLIAFLDKDLEEIKKWISFNVESHYDFIHLISSLSNVNEDFKKLSKDLLNGLKVILPNIEFDKVLRLKDIVITRKLFEQIVLVFYKTMKKEKIIINEDDDAFTKKQKEMKLRTQRIKNQNGKKDGNDLNDIITAVLYEFPQYKIIEILEMNLYTVYFLFGIVGKIANYEVSKIAAGNGLTKKHKYLIEK